MRKIATLNLQLGLVNVSMGINSFLDYTGLSFKQLCPNCETPIQYKRVCSKCQEEVAFSTLKSGFEISKENIVVIDKQVFNDLKNYPTKVLAVIPEDSEYEFITEKCYLLTPDRQATKQYFLLLNILMSEKKQLVVEFVMRKNIHLAIVKPMTKDGITFLMLKQILYADKIKPIEPLQTETTTEEELKLAKQLITLITQSIENKNYLDIIDKRAEILKKVLSGEVIKVEKPVSNDLLEQLKKSVETTQKTSEQPQKIKKKKVCV